MRALRLCSAAVMVCAIGAIAETVSAAMIVRHMNLQQMCGAAGRIFRGTVLGVSDGAVRAGGGEFATTVYRIRVDEHFKGPVETVKGQRIATLQFVRDRRMPSLGPVRPLPLFDDLPVLREGHDYLILATRASRSGLSSTVGLKQGVFKLAGKPGQETAVNGIDNVGLNAGPEIRTARGPVPYTTLRQSIRRYLGR